MHASFEVNIIKGTYLPRTTSAVDGSHRPLKSVILEVVPKQNVHFLRERFLKIDACSTGAREATQRLLNHLGLGGGRS